ncbi:hypothetical protein O988_00781 [Pseudogymnoascus sp. VKM F-3808]|nr:hypothetical protein O988_00781 [Pseudogymnoascus sp. VKM F-3808]
MAPSLSFLCTFCWVPQYPPSPLKTLGTESRICCQGCWEQILDLAICWVCGEVVVRCDEAVSLRWCFWHRCCFGCLICGTRLRPQEGEGAVELDEIPVCEGCEEEVLDGDGLGLGRENVDRRDGGLGKTRWERLVRSNDSFISKKAFHETRASPPPAYITITDPINGPSFQSSPTKPIPLWMRQLPNGREREKVRFLATASPAAAVSELPSAPAEQNTPPEAPIVPETILAYNDRRMTMSTPPKMHNQLPESYGRAVTPLYTGGEMDVEYLKRHHLRTLEGSQRRLQESRTGNVALEKVRGLGSVKQVVDRAKSQQIKEMEVWRVDEGEGKWCREELLRKELNGLFRQG